MPALLSSKLWFPDPAAATTGADLDGLVAVGGDLSVDRLLLAYRSGLFPWTVNPITWWSPDPRGILPLDTFHVSRSLQRILKQAPFRVTRNQAFQAVMEGCAAPAPGRRSTWIHPQFIRAYTRLHQAGHAHSVECWSDDRLVGGVYGVGVGALFAAESMFHRASNASKIALAHLVEHLRTQGFLLLDIQMVTPATEKLGALEIPRTDYLRRLETAVQQPANFKAGS